MKRKNYAVILVLAVASSMGLYWQRLEAQQAAPPASAQQPGAFGTSREFPFKTWTQDPRREQQRIELSELDQQTHKIAAELRTTPDAKKEAELRKLVEEYFDKRHASQVAEMKVLAEKLTKMQELLKKREQKKDEILDRRVKQLLGENDDPDWELTSERPSSFPPNPWFQQVK